ncbi:MAG: histidinol-phosphatase HisJ family protein [Bacteroidales bacterium]|nr:histidinol-phosphatase HisJ family protein [Bacteroidales bacterium]
MSRFFDNHNHCQFSFDGGRTTAEASARAAYKDGLCGMCFTDHYDPYTPPMKAAFEDMVPEVFDVPSQQAEIDRVNSVLKSEGIPFKVFKGIEIGLQENCRDAIKEVLDNNQFDHIIASVHYLDDTDPFWGGYYEGKTWKEAYGHYLETIYKEMTWLGKDFDIMGHYDYVTRYAPYPEASIMYKDFSDILDEMLRYLAEEGKALEINTKTYQVYKGRTPELDPNILLRYKELGGEIISLGSDSHDAGRAGYNFPRIAEFIKSLGFKYTAHFEARKLCQEPI